MSTQLEDNATEESTYEAPDVFGADAEAEGDPVDAANVIPPPVPEGQSYFARLGLGKRLIESVPYASDKANNPTKKDLVFYKADVNAKFERSEDDDTDLSFFQAVASVRGKDSSDITSWPIRGTTVSGIVLVAALANVYRKDFANDKEFLAELKRVLLATPRPLVKITRLQWQWSMKVDDTVVDKNGKPVKYKTVKYGMQSATKREDGTHDPVLYFAPNGALSTKAAGGTPITARAVVLQMERAAE